jgi:hypothetical protein
VRGRWTARARSLRLLGTSLLTGAGVAAGALPRPKNLRPVVTVYLAGVQLLQLAEPTLTSSVRLAFTAGTGAVAELHLIRTVSFSAFG